MTMSCLRIAILKARVRVWTWARDRAVRRANASLRRLDAVVAMRAHWRLMQARADLDRAERNAKGD